MSVTDIVADVRAELNTELSRLGSSKSLYADTEGNMKPEAVLAAMADATNFAAETADGWTNEDDGYAAVYESVAETEREHYDAVVGELESHEPGERPESLAVLRGLETPLERLGGLLGWTLVVDEKASQATGFFTGQADPGTASLFREFGDDYEAMRGSLLDALEDAAVDEDAGDATASGEDDADFTGDRDLGADQDALAQARSAAEQVVGAAYDQYVERLEAQGVNPKPVC